MLLIINQIVDDIDASWTYEEGSNHYDDSYSTSNIGEEWSVIERTSSTAFNSPSHAGQPHQEASSDPSHSSDSATISAAKKTRGLGGWFSSAKNRTIGLLYNLYRSREGLFFRV